MTAKTPFTQGILICPTTHIDWDWVYTFDQYYASNSQATGSVSGRDTVQNIYNAAVSLFSRRIGFTFSVTEVGFLQRYARDNPAGITALAAAGDDFCLMGGGITSPDNLVCAGELFIRNYLVGRTWAKQVGLESNLYDSAWLPDDFGHDPQLPVVLNAMGLTTAGLSRVPGSPQGSPGAAPIDPPGPSIASQLNSSGLVFHWQAGDGSRITALFMPNTYGTVGYLDADDISSNAQTVNQFVNQYRSGWPGGLRFIPVGIDFATPSVTSSSGEVFSWLNVTHGYNSSFGNTNGVKGTTGTFKTYMDAVLGSGAALPVNAPLNAQNYWTGYFASRPELKRNQYAAVRALMSAEVISALLRTSSSYATSSLDAFDSTVWNGWEVLAPSSHHDFVTGTSPDNVYEGEQLPLSRQGVSVAKAALDQGMALLAQGISAKPQSQELPVVVCNTLGFERVHGLLAELTPPPADLRFHAVKSVRTRDGLLPIQRAANGNLLFMAAPPSAGYETVYLSTLSPPGPIVVAQPAVGDTAILENDLIRVTLSKANAWSISQFSYGVDGGSSSLFASQSVGNQLRFYKDTGNIYQFGNEPYGSTNPPSYGTFSEDTSARFVGGDARWLEQGPYRYRLQAEVTEQVSGHRFTLEYSLVVGERFLRMKLTGASPSGRSVVVAFPMVDPNGNVPANLSYGTPHYQHDVLPVPNWPGPTFVATHDYVFPCLQQGSQPVGGIYHQGIPAWTLDDAGVLLGVVLRNTPGGGRGASGSDSGWHEQEYVVAPPLSVNGTPRLGTPLKDALSVTTPLEARFISGGQGGALAETGSLGQVTATNAGTPVESQDVMIRVARVQAPGAEGGYPSAGNATTSGAIPTSLVVRTEKRGSQATQLTVRFPFLAKASNAEMQAVTALEAPLTELAAVPSGTDTVTVDSPYALSALRIAWRRTQGG
ncbi:alpha-mannosidase [Corallococcus coralloides DSM 2259]|uniref:Alpha-mannosidase n=1 Tax=Corallococcus coralloides (strain ATCC 25202 / DSM 2259 / NBRC 100086 / M2) TaxID=1144275 RepID=H8MLR5_CORCM|nr:alpha-mannosidase [Corallococcus coralloides]AFE10743.1 alpha-mannosidase [Corallococcus coralloides DSM 2259]